MEASMNMKPAVAGLSALALLSFVLTRATAAPADPCPAATARIKKRVCVVDVPNAAVFDGLVVGSKLRFTRYLAPAKSGARLPLVFMDSNTYELHQDMVIRGFAPLFPALDVLGYAHSQSSEAPPGHVADGQSQLVLVPGDLLVDLVGNLVPRLGDPA
jgi:hypothetical protein